jgi:hypothetical protein
MCLVSQRFHEISDDDGVWREQCLHQFGWLSNFGAGVEEFKTRGGVLTKTWKETYKRYAKGFVKHYVSIYRKDISLGLPQ